MKKSEKKLKIYILKNDENFQVLGATSGAIKTLNVNSKDLPKKGSKEWTYACGRMREIFSNEFSLSHASLGKHLEFDFVFNMEYKVRGSLWAKTQKEITEECPNSETSYFRLIDVDSSEMVIPCNEEDVRFFYGLTQDLKK